MSSGKVLKIPQSRSIHAKLKAKKIILPLITTFNQKTPKTLPTIKQTLEKVKTLDRMEDALSKHLT